MFTTFITATLVSVFAAIQGARAEFAVATPSISQCGDVKLTWEKSVGPYNVAVVSPDDPCNDVLVDLGDHDLTHITWYNVTLSPGTEVMISVLDSGSDEGWSGKITIANGTDSCLPGKAVSSSSAASSSASASASSSAAVTSAGGTTLVVTGTTFASSSANAAATPVGAANAGSVPVSGAMSSVRLPAAATVLGSLAAIAAALVL